MRFLCEGKRPRSELRKGAGCTVLRVSRTVLIVEDDLDLRQALEEVLQEHGYTVVTARDAEHALTLLTTIVRPCIVLLDYLMPGTGADGFLSAIEALADADSFAIVLMSGMREVKLRSDKRVTCKLLKPFQMEELLGLLETHCGKPGVVVVGP